MTEVIPASLEKLIQYCEQEGFMGYDPYDTLNSSLNFHAFGKLGPLLAIQIQKRNPVNIRGMIGIRKGINPKGMGLFLKAYSILYKKTLNKKYLENLYSDRKIDRVEEIKATAQEELDKAYAEIEENENKLLSGQKGIESGKEKLQEGKKQYEQGLKSYEDEIKAGELSISNGKKRGCIAGKE